MSRDLSSPLSSPAQDGEARLPYMPGLDGLRALAVIAVLLYHAGLPIQGGFLGVEVFFVISGFLITALLHAEWTTHKRIDLPGFWLRRARRLLPALLFTLLGTVLIAALLLGGERSNLGADLLAGLGYVMNWHLIASGQSYFDPLVRPSLLQHLWSLAVEEQFYLLWPLIFVAGIRVLRRRGLLLLILAAAVGSLALMAALYRPGSDPSRVYYGTDTRAGGLLIGAALALLWTPKSTPVAHPGWWRWLLNGGGILALGALLVSFVAVSERHSLLYRGGFALIDLLSVVLILAATYPGTRLLPQLLGSWPLRVIGLRSYGLYLWHWPIFMVTRPYLDLPLAGLPLFGLRLLIVAALVEVSYRCIELPVRRGFIERMWRRRASGKGQPLLGWPRPAMAPVAVRWLGLLVPMLVLLTAGAASLRLDMPRTGTGRTAAPPPGSRSQGESGPTSVSRLEPLSVPARTPTVVGDKPASLSSNLDASGSTELGGEPTPIPTAAGSAATSVSTPSPTPTPERPQPLDPALIAQLQAVLDNTLADGTIPGGVLSVSIPGYEPWSGASGLANSEQGRSMEPATLIHLSSITKMYTAVVVLQLVEEGQIDLDAPIGTYLPEIVPLANRTTVRQLLSHTSGIFDYLEDSRFFLEAYQNPERTYTSAELVEMVAPFGAAFEPGTAGAWKYSSTNYVILGMLVEQVTGRPMAEQMRQRIFEPLGLEHSFFAPYQPVQGTVAQGYIGTSDRVDVSMTFVFATGNIVATAGDLRQFVDALFAGRLLNAQSMALMTSVVDTGGAYDMPELHYGLGLMQANLAVGPGPNGEERPEALSAVLGHIGGIAGSRSAVWHVPASGITIALGMNQANIDPNVLARDTLEAILTWQGQ